MLAALACVCQWVCGGALAAEGRGLSHVTGSGDHLKVQTVSMGSAVAPPVGRVTGPFTTLDDLPWQSIPEPPPGYQHRTVVECAGRSAIMLIDTGAAFSFVLEEIVVVLLNQAIADGYTSDSPHWPLAGLYSWGHDSPANSASRDGGLQVRGTVWLRIAFIGLCGRREVRCLEFRCFRRGCGQGIGLTLGGPALDPAPLGLGFKPRLDGHQMSSLGDLLLPRAEAGTIQRGLEGARIASVMPLPRAAMNVNSANFIPVRALSKPEESPPCPYMRGVVARAGTEIPGINDDDVLNASGVLFASVEATLGASEPACQAERPAVVDETKTDDEWARPAFTGRDVVLDKPPGGRRVISFAPEPETVGCTPLRGFPYAHLEEARVLSRSPCGLGVAPLTEPFMWKRRLEVLEVERQTSQISPSADVALEWRVLVGSASVRAKVREHEAGPTLPLWHDRCAIYALRHASMGDGGYTRFCVVPSMLRNAAASSLERSSRRLHCEVLPELDALRVSMDVAVSTGLECEFTGSTAVMAMSWRLPLEPQRCTSILELWMPGAASMLEVLFPELHYSVADGAGWVRLFDAGAAQMPRLQTASAGDVSLLSRCGFCTGDPLDAVVANVSRVSLDMPVPEVVATVCDPCGNLSAAWRVEAWEDVETSGGCLISLPGSGPPLHHTCFHYRPASRLFATATEAQPARSKPLACSGHVQSFSEVSRSYVAEGTVSVGARRPVLRFSVPLSDDRSVGIVAVDRGAESAGGSLELQCSNCLQDCVFPVRGGDVLPGGGGFPSREVWTRTDVGESPRAVSEGIPAVVADDPPVRAVGLRADSLVGVEAGSVEIAREACGPREPAHIEQGGAPGQGERILIFASSSWYLVLGGAERRCALDVPLFPEKSNEENVDSFSERLRDDLGERPSGPSEPLSGGLRGQCVRRYSQAHLYIFPHATVCRCPLSPCHW